MNNIIIFIVLIFGLFAFVIFFGAPYLPTHRRREKDVLDLLDLKPGQTLLELGSGDGRILLLAGQRGVKAIGYELNPLLVIYSRLLTWRYRKLVSVRWANYWSVKLPPTDGIYVFLLQKYMKKLHKKVEQEYSKPVKLVSYAFSIEGKKPTAEKQGMFLYKYK